MPLPKWKDRGNQKDFARLVSKQKARLICIFTQAIVKSLPLSLHLNNLQRSLRINLFHRMPAALLIGGLTGGKSRLHIFSVHGSDSFSDILPYPRMLGHALGHINFSHLLGNLTIVLLTGPILEEKYGTRYVTVMALITKQQYLMYFSSMLCSSTPVG